VLMLTGLKPFSSCIVARGLNEIGVQGGGGMLHLLANPAVTVSILFVFIKCLQEHSQAVLVSQASMYGSLILPGQIHPFWLCSEKRRLPKY